MTMQFKKQFKNQAQAGYMQSNEPQIAGGEAGKKNRIKTQSQSGRSMIEMLGVLAIIAVLSIGGIVGYKLAMNHYQASQIAHEMNIMRTDAQIKIAQGAEKLTLGSPYDEHKINFNDYGTDFGCALADDENVELGDEIFCYVANAYYIELKEIPEGVCKPLARLINGMDNLIDFYVNEPDAEGENKDTCNKDFNTLTVVFGADSDSNAVKCDDADECPDNLPVCLNHVCVECETYHDCQGETPQCDEASHTCKSCAEIDPEKPLWDNNECKECPADQPWNGEFCGCLTNDDCESDEFCMTSECEGCDENGQLTEKNCRSYTCASIGNPQKKTIIINGESKTYYKSPGMNWWSVKRYCEALGTQGKGRGIMTSLEELGCTETPGITGCENSEIRNALYSSENGDSFGDFAWTRTPYDNPTDTSCRVYHLHLYNGNVHYHHRNNDDNFAICE